MARASQHALSPKHALLLALARLWMRSWRLRWPAGRGLPEKGVLVLWHEHLPACIPAFARRGIRVLISRSSDGSLAAAACAGLGYRVFRGSTSGGALSGMKALARGIEDGGADPGDREGSGPGGLAGMALDGPRGPRRRPGPGSLWLAGLAGVPVYPIAVRAAWAVRLRTWDRCLLPLPFARVEVMLGEACHPAGPEEMLSAMDANQAALERLSARPGAPGPGGHPGGRSVPRARPAVTA